jgi:hypothetical protein
MTYKDNLAETVGEIVDEKLSKSGGIISRDQLRDALETLDGRIGKPKMGGIAFPYLHAFDLADAIMREVAAQTEHDCETLTYGEIRASYQRLGSLLHPERLLEDVVAHRQAYKPGTIVKDAAGQLYRRRSPGNWRVLGDNEPVENTVPVRPLEVIYAPS